MGFWRGLKRRVKAAAPFLFFSVLASYFVWHSIHGERGTLAREQRQEDIQEARRLLAAAQMELSVVQRRVAGLRSDALDRDQLDERSRALLNLSDPQDIVVPYGPGQRLFRPD
jgi:cell division protein FtsB